MCEREGGLGPFLYIFFTWSLRLTPLYFGPFYYKLFEVTTRKRKQREKQEKERKRKKEKKEAKKRKKEK